MQGKEKTCNKCTVEKIRNAVEYIRPGFVYGVEESVPKDYIHQRGSGVDHIIAKIAKKNNIALAFSLSSLLHSKNKAQIMGRMSQNISLSRKYGVTMLVGSFAKTPEEMRSPHEVMSLFILLGMHQNEAKKSVI